MQPAAPSSPYRQHAGGFGGGGGFGSAMAVSNPYASSAAPVPGRSPVGGLACACVCVCVCARAHTSLASLQLLCLMLTGSWLH